MSPRLRMARVRKARPPLEKTVQWHIQQLLATWRAKVYVIGTRRPRGKPCPKCGTFVTEHQGTCQTKGIPDLLAFLPPPPGSTTPHRQLFIECKSGAAMTEEQVDFRDHCIAADVDHLVGNLDDVIAWGIAHGYATPHQFPHYRLPETLR